MSSLLLVIDLKNAFINEHTEKLPDRIKVIIDNNKYAYVAFTRFINFEDSIFVKKLNWRGCILKIGFHLFELEYNVYVLKK